MVLNWCQDPPPVSVVTSIAPVGTQQTLYVPSSDHLYSVNASDGTVRWCQQVKPTQEMIQAWSTRPYGRHHAPPHLRFGTPRVTNGVVYVCASSDGQYTCAFNAGDGTLRWRTPTDAWSVSMPFGDFAVPLLKDGIVYTGTYVLNEQDGAVLWRIALETQWFSPQTLVDNTMYAVSQRGIYAINAQHGEVSWLYEPDEYTFISGPLVVADHLLYAGTQGSVDHPETSYCFALDTETGAEQWRYPMGIYIGAVIHDENIYVSSGDRCLYALEKHNGSLRWKYQFVDPGHHAATMAGNVLYINTDGAYALSSADGTVLWHQRLGSNPSVSFTPSVVLDGVVYLASIDGHGHSILYSLNASNGTEYWHSHYPDQIIPLAVAR
ncbi:MAG: PQQ-binding-like beta-propeller repeat protein [Ktedonobacteraceae bacterium]